MRDIEPSSLLYLAEGDSESLNSWSGSSHRLVNAMRRHGLSVNTANVLPGRLGRWAAMALALRPSRARWAASYHLGNFGYMLRTRRAVAVARRQAPKTVVLQSGATFDIGRRPEHAWYLYCDANAMLAERGRPYSTDSALPPRLLGDVLRRERETYHRCTGIFAMSEMARQSFITDFGVPGDRVTTVFAGPNLEIIPEESEVAGPRLGPPTIAFVGKAFLRKGGDVLLAAFAVVRQAIPDARLVIAGSTPSMGVGDGVEVRGWLDPKGSGPGSLSALYQSADLFCLPSRYEPFGIVFVEAMLHALPCVGTLGWAMPEIIEPGATGWLAAMDDTQGLATILIDALSDRARLRAMGMEARRRAMESFSWDRVVARMLTKMRSDADSG